MSAIKFDKDAMADWYAKQHLKTDPGITKIYYLPDGAPEREIRFVEINKLLATINGDTLEPIDFGVDTGAESEHKLLVVDVTPSQWGSIDQGALSLPAGWSLKNNREFTSKRKR